MIDNLGNYKNFFSNIFAKIFIALFYIFIFAFFLYFPKISQIFFNPKKAINVYAFTDMISSESIQEFQKQTGIAVYMQYFDTNEELLAKFRISKGKGYDLITPSDFIIELLIKQNLLQKINHSKISNFKNLDKRLLGHFFDPKNGYSVPYFWSILGIIFKNSLFNKDLFKLNWNFIFKDQKHLLFNSLEYKICMTDVARDAISLASIYLFGRIKNLTDQELLLIQNLLISQKKFVEVYMSGSLQYYLFAYVVPLAVTTTAFAKKIMEISDEFDFVVPKQGSILAIDNLAIPSSSTKVDLVYKFIDFLISKDIVALNSKIFGYNPSNKDSYKILDKKFLHDNSFFPDDEMFGRLHIIRNDLDIKKLENLWLSVQLA